MNRNNVAALIAIAAVVVVLILGFRFLGSPASQRLVRGDAQDVWALYMLAGQLKSAWTATPHELPATLDQISVPTTKKSSISGKPFVYHRKNDSHYELCSTFATDNRQLTETNTTDQWLHPKGDYCFALDASQPVPIAPSPIY